MVCSRAMTPATGPRGEPECCGGRSEHMTVSRPRRRTEALLDSRICLFRRSACNEAVRLTRGITSSSFLHKVGSETYHPSRSRVVSFDRSQQKNTTRTFNLCSCGSHPAQAKSDGQTEGGVNLTKRRRRFKQNESLETRLAQFASNLRALAGQKPQGEERSSLLKRAYNADRAIDLERQLREHQ
ncbi:hypothetical protein ABIC02_006343 [Bradyrhizobium sp. RT5a]